MTKQKKTLEEKIEAKKNAIKNHCKRVHVSYDEVITMFYELYEKYHKENFGTMKELVGEYCHPCFYVPDTIVNTLVTNYVTKPSEPRDYKRSLRDSLYDLYCLISGEMNINHTNLY